MTADYILAFTDPQATLERVGGKGAALTEMTRAGMPVPGGFHISTSAYRAFVDANDLQPVIAGALDAVDPHNPGSIEVASSVIVERFAEGRMAPEVAAAIATAYAALAGTEPVVAVRSSATAEDLPDASFAGQQETYLNIKGIDQVLDAVKRCWASLWTARAIGYRARQDVRPDSLALAVVVQQLVPAEAAGILFTANPMTGRRTEAVINAAWGLGEAIVGGEVTPDTYIVEKATGRVLRQEIADKTRMTVLVNGGTRTVDVAEDLRRAPVLDDAQIARLTRLATRIEDLYGDPRDIEWALADGRFAIVQARPITALPEPTTPAEDVQPPETWPLPNPDGKYMRGSIVDFMPHPLTPLFSSMAIPAINEAIRQTVAEMIPGQGISFLDNYLLTINDYAYLTIDLKARDLWWILVRMLPALPRLMANSVTHYEEVAHPRYAEVVAGWRDRNLAKMKSIELVDGARELTRAMGRYLTTLQVDSLGIAAGTEMLFTRVYDKLIRREDDPPAAAYLLGADSLPIRAEKALYDLAEWCSERDELADYLHSTPVAELAGRWSSDPAPAEISAEVWQAWQERFQSYLDSYGHSVYDLDFSKTIPAHDPTPQLQALRAFIGGIGRDPYTRQARLLAERQAAIGAVRDRIKGLKRRVFDITLRWAQTFTQLREDSIFEIGLAYPLLRRMLLEVGDRLTDTGVIDRLGDIFWLDATEIEAYATALDYGGQLASAGDVVAVRKARWRAERLATPPAQLPKTERIMGMKTDVFMPVDAATQAEKHLKGIGCSPGQVTATARVLEDPGHFDDMRPGDILVADITTPAWTPLFALASGIVTNVGGPLSHGSIVAREYGIPAVLGTGIATKRIQSGQRVTVDGDAGIVELH